MNKGNKWFFALLICSVFLSSCKKGKIEKYKAWGFYTPSYFPVTEYDFSNNTQSYARFTLGRELFYDTLLSSDNTISCATCHANTHAFAGHNTALSAGVSGLFGTRNAPAIFNLAWSNSFMWDGGINHLEIMPVAPITNPVEMNETLNHVVSKIQGSSKYEHLFKEAYGNNQVTDQRILKALAQFMAMIISDNAKYDKVKRGEASFTQTEQEGYALFQQKCNQCHAEPLFTDNSFRNNGLTQSTADEGRFIITQNPSDKGKFKVPSLRNVLITYPYMHDGRFYTINQALEHYNSGITNSTTLDPLLENGLSLSASEKTKIIAFLRTLNDETLLTNSWLSEPKQ